MKRLPISNCYEVSEYNRKGPAKFDMNLAGFSYLIRILPIFAVLKYFFSVFARVCSVFLMLRLIFVNSTGIWYSMNKDTDSKDAIKSLNIAEYNLMEPN